MSLYDKIDSLNILQFQKLHYLFSDSLKGTKYEKEVIFDIEPKHINLFTIRNNDVYMTNDMIYDNDYVIVTQNGSIEKNSSITILRATADPKMRRQNIANLVQQQWYGNIRPHHWMAGRLAVCQDNDKVWVRRYQTITQYIEEYGNFTINIHNKNGLSNSSLGCTILASDESYKKLFLPTLKEVQSIQKKIPCSLLQIEMFNELYKEII